jgi:hypothetical protein
MSITGCKYFGRNFGLVYIGLYAQHWSTGTLKVTADNSLQDSFLDVTGHLHFSEGEVFYCIQQNLSLKVNSRSANLKTGEIPCYPGSEYEDGSLLGCCAV